MDKQLIERIVLSLSREVLNENEEGGYLLSRSHLCAFVKEAVARIDAEREKEAVAWMNELNGFICKEKTRDYHVPLFLSTPTIQEGWALVPIEPTQAMMEVHDELLMQGVSRGRNVIYAAMIAAAQGERNAD